MLYYLSRHKCSLKEDEPEPCPKRQERPKGVKLGGRVQKKSKALLPALPCQDEDLKKILNDLANDNIGMICRNDPLIVQIGERDASACTTHEKQEALRNKMRELARLLQVLRESTGKPDAKLGDFLDSTNVKDITSATKILCKFDEDTKLFGIPSLPAKVVASLKRCIKVKSMSALGMKDIQTKKELENFEEFLDYHWEIDITRFVTTSKTERSRNSIRVLPMQRDIVKFNKKLNRR